MCWVRNYNKAFRYFCSGMILLLYHGHIGRAMAQSKLNVGLGPLTVRNQFPLTLRFLNVVPDQPSTLTTGHFSFSYQLAVGNTFVNTRDSSGTLDVKAVQGGLQTSDFVNEDGSFISGSNAYVDAEVYRHFFQVNIGLPYQLQLSVGIPLVSYTSGFMDLPIENFHDLVGVSNSKKEGGFRSDAKRNRYAIYLIRNNEFLFEEETPTELVLSDPVVDLKWNFFEGSRWWPAMSLKISNKLPSHTGIHKTPLASSKHWDHGVYYLASKDLYQGHWFVYFQGGQTFLEIPDESFKDHLDHTILALEYHPTPERSFILQTVRQSSLFPAKWDPLPEALFPQSQVDRGLATSTDMLGLGMKQQVGRLLYSWGVMEDLTQNHNETDFIIFFEAEWAP